MSRPVLGVARRAFRWSRWLALALLLPALLAAGFGQWWLLPRLNDHREALAAALGDYLRVPARIEAVAAERDGGWLGLRLQGVSLCDPQTGAVLARFDRAAATLDLWRSLREWRPVLGHIRLEGVNLTLEQGTDGIPRLRADTGPAETAPSLAEVARWLFTVGRLDLMGDRLTVRRRDGSTLQLRHPYFQVRDTGSSQRLAFAADLPAELGDRIRLSVERSHAHPESWRGDFALRPDRTHSFELTQRSDRWRFGIRDLRVEDVAAWMLPWLDESARRWLASLAPRGEIPEITAQTESTGSYVATVQLREVAFQPARDLPGFDHLTGTLELTPEQGRIALDSRKVRIDTAGLLRAPIVFDNLTGTVRWTHGADGWRLDSSGLDFANADLDARVQGGVAIPATGTPVLDLQARYRDVRVDAARRYLPVTVIPPEGVAWLDQALIGGRLVAGEGMLRGPADAFPFDRGEGLFETRFQFEDAVLDYAPGWPRLEAARGTARFRNRGLQVEIESGRLLDTEIENIAARIDDLESVVIQARGRVEGAGASLWRAFADSPAGRELGEDWPELRIGGANTLDLELTIPTDARPVRARGRVGLLDNRLALPAWNLELDRLRGELRFTEAALDARALSARLRGESIRLDLDLAGRAGRRELQARLRGRLGPRALVGEPAARTLEPYLSGKSLWDAMLTVPIHRRARPDAAPPLRLELSSDLRGVAVRLPASLNKAAGESRPLKISLHPGERDALDLTLDYGEDVRAALELADLTRDPQLKRGELRINAGAANLPEAPGLMVTADLPRWELAPLAFPEAAGLWRGLRRLDARIGELILGSQIMTGVTLDATRREKDTLIELDGEALAGRLTLPDEPSPERPINAALQRLYLRHPAGSAAADSSNASALSLDPRRVPPLVLSVADVRWDGTEPGRLRMVAMPHSGGIRLTEFTLESERQRIIATGDWRQAGGNQVSRLQATLRSPALGATLAAFGYSGIDIARGETEAELAVEWAGTPAEFALERLEGTLKLEVGSGQLLDVDPGMGRVVGLFNVQNLLRRLTLDFSDLVQPGLSFDRIAGEIAFQNGQAYTDNLTIEAPAARIRIEGRTNLKERDYDQRITVIPQLGGALPVAGALAGGPAVGAAVFVAERLLQKGIERATQYRYALTGPWDRPVMRLLDESQPTAPSRGLVGDP